MERVVCFVGHSGSGKTTFLEKVVRELKGRGYRIAVIKHTPHGFDMDCPGKDSVRFATAGAYAVAVSSSRAAALIVREGRELPLEELVDMVAGRVDLVLAEGYKGCRWPKIEVCRNKARRGVFSPEAELWAVVSDDRFDVPVPHYRPDDALGVADLLEGRCLRIPV